MKERNTQLSRFAAIFAGGTLISRVAGLARDIVVGAMVPDVARDAFLFAFRLTNMLRDMLGEGAANAAFVPVLTECHEKEGDAAFRAMTRAIMGAMLIVFTVVTIAGILLIPAIPWIIEALRPITGGEAKTAAEFQNAVTILQWTFPYLLLIGLAVFAMAPLFVVRHYSTPSWSPVLLNIAMIAAVLGLTGWFENPAWPLVIGTWLGGILQIAAMWWAMRKHAGVFLPSFKLRNPGVIKATWLMVPVLLGQAAGEVNKAVDSFFAYSLEEGTVSALFYSNRLIQLPLAIFGTAVAAAILPSLSRASARNDTPEIRATLLYGFRQTFFLIAPSSMGLLILSAPLIRLFFQHGHFDARLAEMTSNAQIYYTFGLLTFAWVKVAVQGFYAAHDTKTPVTVATFSMILNILLIFVLVRPMGYRGLALATSISFAVNFLLLYLLLCNRFGLIWDGDTFKDLLRMCLALLVMSAVTYGLSEWICNSYGVESFGARLAAVAVPVSAAVAAYAGMCKILNVPEFDQYLAAIARRRKKS